MGAFSAFVLFMIAFHCYLKRNERKRIKCNVMREVTLEARRKAIEATPVITFNG